MSSETRRRNVASSQMLHRRAERNRDVEHGGLVLIPHHHGDVARLVGDFHAARLGGFGHVAVIRLIKRDGRDVAGFPIGEAGGDFELLIGLGLERFLGGLHVERHEFRRGGEVVRRALLKPRAENAVAFGAGFEPQAAAVRDDVRRLHEQEALVRRRREHAPPACFLHEVLVILLRFEAEQRKLETVLSLPGLRVARAHVAAGLGEHGDDVVDEAHGAGRICGTDHKRQTREDREPAAVLLLPNPE